MNRPLKLLAFACLLIAGCTSSNLASKNIDIGPETIDRIEPGCGDKFVLALLGEPQSKAQLDDGMELWRWTLRERRTAAGNVVYRIETDPEAHAERRAYVEFKNGRVRRAWRD